MPTSESMSAPSALLMAEGSKVCIVTDFSEDMYE
jgi:hypothetical protein